MVLEVNSYSTNDLRLKFQILSFNFDLFLSSNLSRLRYPPPSMAIMESIPKRVTCEYTDSLKKKKVVERTIIPTQAAVLV